MFDLIVIKEGELPRPRRVFVEGGVYHVYNRLGRGERLFQLEAESEYFVEVLHEVANRDGLTVFAWSLMPNHFHLAVRTSSVSLDRPMRSLQQRVTRFVNRKGRVFGPLWQGRYRCKLVDDQRYLEQLLFYIHLNPVKANLVSDPVEYRSSGHRELLGLNADPVVDVDEVLRVFGKTRRSARAAYVRDLKGSVDETWIGETPGCLPWWRFGRPKKSEAEDPEIAVRARRKREEQGPDWRPEFEAREFVTIAAGFLKTDVEELRSRRRTRHLIKARELIMVLGVERYRLRLNELSRELRKSTSGMSKSIARAATKRIEMQDFRADLAKLDQFMARVKMRART